MKLSDLPTRFNIPFADAAGGGYVRVVPEASQVGVQDGAASLTDGFPPLNFLPVGAGGVPPFGQDMNGILRQVTKWSQWQGAGGLVPYNSAFSTAIGGYPVGCVLAGTNPGIVWLNLADDNTTNPDTGGANWAGIATSASIQNNSYIYAAAGGTANAITLTISPATTFTEGASLVFKASATNNGAMTVNINAGGNVSLLRADGSAVSSGDVQTGQYYRIVKASGAPWRIQQSMAASQAEADAGLINTKFLTPALARNSFRFLEAVVTSGQSIPNNVMTNPAINSPTTNTFIDSVVASTAKITAGTQDAGVWMVTGFAQYDGSGGNKGLYIHLNGAPTYPSSSRMAVQQNGPPSGVNDAYIVAALIQVAAGDIVTMDIIQNTGSAQSFNIGKFRVARIG